MLVTIVVAMTESGLMGRAGKLPWRLPEDLKHFKQTTLGHACVMGRKTFDENGKALPGRRNLVVTRNPNPPAVPGIEWFRSLDAAFDAARAGGETDCMLCGGSHIFREALERDLVDRMIISWVHLTPEPTGDTYFPAWDRSGWSETGREQYANFTVMTYDRQKQRAAPVA